jgi:hypothetical protein
MRLTRSKSADRLTRLAEDVSDTTFQLQASRMLSGAS